MQREQNKRSHSPAGLILNQNEETGLQRSWCVRDSGTEALLIPPLLASLPPFRASSFSYLFAGSQAKHLWIPIGLKLASHFVTGRKARGARGQACPRAQRELGLARRSLPAHSHPKPEHVTPFPSVPLCSRAALGTVTACPPYWLGSLPLTRLGGCTPVAAHAARL